MVLLLVGWTVTLGAGPGAVVSSSTGAPAGAGSRFYYTVLTLGIGDYVPRGTWAQVGTVVAAFSGLFVVTLAITYLLNVVTAVVAQRTLAAEVWLVTGTSLVTDRDAGQDLDRYLGSLAPRVIELAMRHLAYPVMHRFTDTTPDRSAVVAMALLTDLVDGVQRRTAAAGSGRELLAASLDVYLDTVHGPDPSGSGGDSRRDRMSALVAVAGKQWPTLPGDQV